MLSEQPRHVGRAQSVLAFTSGALHFATAPQARDDEVHSRLASRALELDGVAAAFSRGIARVGFLVRFHVCQTSTSIPLTRGTSNDRKAGPGHDDDSSAGHHYFVAIRDFLGEC